LSGCGRSGAPAASASADALPLTAAQVAPPQRAPVADALPAATPAPVVRVRNPGDEYAYLDDAYHEAGAYEDAPPDYAFDYDGTSPWAWQGDDGWEFVEPVGGGYRNYYYRPGAAWPYLIRDGGYAYGFDGPQLVVIYDSAGRLMPRDWVEGRADIAGRYLARSQGILEASRRSGRRGVAAANWAAARSEIAAQRAEWDEARSRQSAWQAYGQAHADQARRWTPERDRRQDYARRFEGWRRADFQGDPPAPASTFGGGGQRQAQTAPPARQVAPPVGPAPAPGLPQAGPDRQQAFDQRRQEEQQGRRAEDQRRFADEQQQNQAAAQQRQHAFDERRQDDQRRFVDQQQQRQQFDQQRQAQDQQRQADQQRRFADQEQQRQQQEAQQQQQRFAAQQQHQQADQQQRAQAEQARQQQAAPQQQSQQQQRFAEQQQRQPAQPQQIQQQPAQQSQRPPGPPGQAHAGRDEHRDNKDRDNKQ
jgi:hypothetical protein